MSTEGKVSKVEVIKANSRHLRGTIQEALVDGSTYFAEENIQVLKFHGMYQQDDRDLRKQLKAEGKDRHYMMMIRARIPGGVLNADQYLQFDQLSETYGNGSLRITTRQTFQLHGVLKGDLKATVQGINEVLITTLGGCGDQVRNIIGCGAPHKGPFYEAVREDMLALVDALSAKTNAYHEIWLDGEKVNFGEDEPEEPLYGTTYMPRKFKLAFAYEGDNCDDVYSNDIGIVAHRSEDHVDGYTLVVGGGMGRTATDKETHPQLALPLCFVKRDELVAVCTAIVKVQRDFGNRTERKFARMKYLIESKGLAWFAAEVEARLGRTLTAPRELSWSHAHDHLGWHSHGDGTGFFGLFVENGRVSDTEQMQLKTALREVMHRFKPMVHLTTQQNIIFDGIAEPKVPELLQLLAAHGVAVPAQLTQVKLNAMACPAMPTCGLAIAESERALPDLLPQFEQMFGELGIAEESISIRMTGCPNGCARPYIAEIGLVGRVIGRYDVFLGASSVGTRMNTLFVEMVPFGELAATLRPVVAAYASGRLSGESFGDFCHRVGFEHLRSLVPVPTPAR